MSSPIEMLVDGKLACWQFRAVITVDALTAGTAIVEITIPPGVGNFYILDTLRLGADAYSGSNAVEIIVRDEDNNAPNIFLLESINNVRRFIPSQDVTDEDEDSDHKMRYTMIAGDSFLHVKVSSLSLNETVTLALRSYIASTVPTITTAVTGTNATIAVSTTLNKVVA